MRKDASRKTDFIVAHLHAAKVELVRLGLDQAAERVLQLIRDLENSITEEQS